MPAYIRLSKEHLYIVRILIPRPQTCCLIHFFFQIVPTQTSNIFNCKLLNIFIEFVITIFLFTCINGSEYFLRSEKSIVWKI
jgi:hypothetical protein